MVLQLSQICCDYLFETNVSQMSPDLIDNIDIQRNNLLGSDQFGRMF